MKFFLLWYNDIKNLNNNDTIDKMKKEEMRCVAVLAGSDGKSRIVKEQCLHGQRYLRSLVRMMLSL